jgi:hypothetical protein
MRNDDHREAPLTLTTALSLWAACVAAGGSAGVFLRVEPGAYAALAAFATGFAVAVVLVDASIRGWLARRGAPCAWTAALGVAVLLVAAGIALSGEEKPTFAAGPWAGLLLFVLPVTVASTVAAVRAAWSTGRSRVGRAVQLAGD